MGLGREHGICYERAEQQVVGSGHASKLFYQFPAGDKNDWITDCASQSQVVPALQQTVALLHDLL
ncbi:MAG: hypothetical protein EWM72_00546 [Nitrospira sp.]|nr:MAG: hypothetical protein EWM72_00546 [Nitrospira sp.]